MPKGYSLQIGFRIRDGRFQIEPNAISKAVRTWPDMEGVLTLTEGAEKTKSWLQIKYWWPVPVKLLSEHCGYTPTQMHYALLGEWSGWVDGPGGRPIPAKPSMSDYTHEDMREIIDWVLIWAPSELGVVVPEPDKDWKKKKGQAA